MAINKMQSPADPMGDYGMEPLPQKKSVAAKIIKLIVAIIIIVALVLIVVKVCWSAYQMYSGDPIAKVSSADWQAIFLDNEQVYFGKVKAVSKDTLTLSDIYYLQVVTKPLQTTQQGATATADNTQQELTLIKLGNEIHGPADRMVINRDKIVLTEKLKSDSRVVKAISTYVDEQKKAATETK